MLDNKEALMQIKKKIKEIYQSLKDVISSDNKNIVNYYKKIENTFDDLEDKLEKSINLEILNVDEWMELGILFALLGNSKKAKKCAEKILNLKPNDHSAIELFTKMDDNIKNIHIICQDFKNKIERSPLSREDKDNGQKIIDKIEKKGFSTINNLYELNNFLKTINLDLNSKKQLIDILNTSLYWSDNLYLS